jgi:quinoprotein dehydrogenase-associated probable ABC transporter substrate-binding protein
MSPTLTTRPVDTLLAVLLLLASALLIGATAGAQPGAQPASAARSSTAAAATPRVTTLRVCADPDNLPFSNDKQEGFENKIAALLATELGASLEYTWWPQRRGFIRNTLRAKECDLLIGVPVGFDPVAATTPYYRSTYYFVTRRDRNLQLASLDDPQLRTLKIGVNVIGEDYRNTPPAHALGDRGIVVAHGYDTFYDDQRRPDDIIKAVVNGDIDVGVVWGPLAGYFAKQAPVALAMTALPDSDSRSGLPFAYDISLGVRRSDKALKAQIESAVERRRGDIARILHDYNVPVLATP